MKKPYRVAFAGFRHPHIMSLLARVQAHPDCEIVAACESDAGTRKRIEAESEIRITHSHFTSMLRESEANIIAIGDVYAHRGKMVLAALQTGRHVISDKPLCTRSNDLEQITRLARKQKLSVGCQLDLVETDGIRQLKAAVQGGKIGRLCTITISAQHPLRLGTRADWYFEPGLHGGTINDIGIHVFDLVPWLTGDEWEEISFARQWNAKAIAFPHFKDCAQFHALTKRGTACFADVSYLAPDALGYDLPQYWRITVHGVRGMAEVQNRVSTIQCVTDNATAFRDMSFPTTPPRGYLQDFLDEIAGNPTGEITSARVLTSSYWALKAQARASESMSGQTSLPLFQKSSHV